MDGSRIHQYWCYMCSQMVELPVGENKCWFCDGIYLQTVGERRGYSNSSITSNTRVSIWSPVLLGLIGDEDASLCSRGSLAEVSDFPEEEAELDRVFEPSSRRQRRRLARVPNHESELFNFVDEWETSDGVAFIDSSSEEGIVLNDSFEIRQHPHMPQDDHILLADYFTEEGMDSLLLHLTQDSLEIEHVSLGQKQVEEMHTVTINERIECSICLEDFQIGEKVKETPCKHKFHEWCLVSWLELQSSCPLCRFQMPISESEIEKYTLRKEDGWAWFYDADESEQEEAEERIGVSRSQPSGHDSSYFLV